MKRNRNRIRHKTIRKLFYLVNLVVDKKRMLSIKEIMDELLCCKSTAYSYRAALTTLIKI
jgi:hypothetical protein